MKLHVYGQQVGHDSAWLVGNKAALYELRDAINAALHEGSSAINVEAADGEAYSFYVVDMEMKDDGWEQLDLPYTDRKSMGFKKTHLPSPPHHIISPERHEELRASLLKAAEKTADLQIEDAEII